MGLEACIPELNVQCALLDDDEEIVADRSLDKLCRALRVDLRGEARIEYRPRFLRTGTNAVVCIDLDGQRRRVGRNRWSAK